MISTRSRVPHKQLIVQLHHGRSRYGRRECCMLVYKQ